jgi:predicted nucleic acid-binding protein
MNAELLRNLWLELTPRRMAQMAVVLALILLTANVSPFGRVAEVAQYLFYGIVVVWGARDAAQAVVSEIRERTWDSQRLSALTPFEMTLGKLLGATSYVWFGGLICLSVVIAGELRDGSPRVWQDLFYFLAIGLLSQAAALFASLIAVRRRQTRTRFNVFQYQAAGVIAGLLAWQGWRMVSSDPADADHIADVLWWGWTIDGQEFYLVSLAVFLAWTLIGCYRLMRLELQVQTYPAVWLVFILFMATYMAGLATVSFFAPDPPSEDAWSLRLGMATATLAFLTYVAVLFEPKDRVLYRWLGEMLAKGRSTAVMSRLQCWMIAYAATMIGGVALAYHLGTAGVSTGLVTVAMIVAGLGFLTRDLGVFLFFGLAPGQKRGDMPAVITLAVLYLLLPRLLGAAGMAEPAILLYPLPGAGWIGAAYAGAEALVMWFLVARFRSKQTAALPQT